MAQDDRILLHLAHLDKEGGFEDPSAIHLVGASHADEYLTIMYGTEMPQHPAGRRLTIQTLGNLANLSTDTELTRRLDEQPRSAFGYWLGLVDPLVRDTRSMGRLADKLLSGPIASEDDATDAVFTAGLFSSISQVVAEQLGLDVPKYFGTGVDDRIRSMLPPGQTMFDDIPKGELDILLDSGLIKKDYVRKTETLRQYCKEMNIQAKGFVALLGEILEYDK